jgi:fructose-bisphosphate aldolase class II
MLMNMKEILAIANEKNFAVPAFNIGTCQIMKAVVECCQEKKAPVIFAVHPKELAFQGDSAMAALRDAAEKAKVPVCIHMDHSSTVEEILHAVRMGFTSVMIDASHKSFEDNAKISKQIVDMVHPLGISVEAELGTIGTTGNDAEGGTSEIIYTDPDDVVKFVNATGIDCLAIAIGTAHGIYPKGFKPQLKLDLLTEIKKKSPVPLVLHGGSANPDEEIAESVKRGINKINISSDTKDALYQELRKTLFNDPKIREPFELYVDGIVEMKKIINHKIELFNASDKVKYYSL